MRTSSNPAFRNLPSGQGGNATFDRGSGMAGGTAAYADRAQVGIGRADAGQRPITVDDIVTKTAITAGAAIVAGGLTAWSGLYVLALPAFIVGFVVSLPSIGDHRRRRRYRDRTPDHRTHRHRAQHACGQYCDTGSQATAAGHGCRRDAARLVTRRQPIRQAKRIVVVGAGLSGLAAALYLTGAGRAVTLLERDDHPGGRVGRYRGPDYEIDSGATVLTLPGLVEQALAAVGSDAAAHDLRIHPVDPSYRARFADDTVIGVYADPEAMAAEVRRTCGAAEADRYLNLRHWLAQIYTAAYGEFMDTNFDSPLDMVRIRAKRAALRDLVRLGAFGRLGPQVDRMLHDPKLARLFTFQALYAGTSPAQALAVYGTIPHMDTSLGVYFPVGGMRAVATALAAAFTGAGGRLELNCEVTGIDYRGRATRVRTRTGTGANSIVTRWCSAQIWARWAASASTPPPAARRTVGGRRTRHHGGRGRGAVAGPGTSHHRLRAGVGSHLPRTRSPARSRTTDERSVTAADPSGTVGSHPVHRAPHRHPRAALAAGAVPESACRTAGLAASGPGLPARTAARPGGTWLPRDRRALHRRPPRHPRDLARPGHDGRHPVLGGPSVPPDRPLPHPQSHAHLR